MKKIMQSVDIEWTYYKNEKPAEEGEYLVIYTFHDDEIDVTSLFYEDDGFRLGFYDAGPGSKDDQVIAWAKKPAVPDEIKNNR